MTATLLILCALALWWLLAPLKPSGSVRDIERDK